jgi:alpha-tubulin suppressor-like RCC1 family protein
MSGVKQVVVVTERMMCVTNGGGLYGWGSVEDGQLGNGTIGQTSGFPIPSNSEIVPLLVKTGVSKVACGRKHTLALDNSGVVWAAGLGGRLGTGDGNSQLTFQSVATDVKDVACGENFSLLVKNDGKLQATGVIGNVNGFSFVTVGADYTQCFGGRFSAFATDTVGDLYGWGGGSDGQLGIGDNQDQLVPTLIPGGGYTFVDVETESAIALRALDII